MTCVTELNRFGIELVYQELRTVGVLIGDCVVQRVVKRVQKIFPCKRLDLFIADDRCRRVRGKVGVCTAGSAVQTVGHVRLDVDLHRSKQVGRQISCCSILRIIHILRREIHQVILTVRPDSVKNRTLRPVAVEAIEREVCIRIRDSCRRRIGRKRFETDNRAENERRIRCGHGTVLIDVRKERCSITELCETDNRAEDLRSVCRSHFAVEICIAEQTCRNRGIVCRTGILIDEVYIAFNEVAVCKCCIEVFFCIIVKRDLQLAFIGAVCGNRNVGLTFHRDAVAVEQVIGSQGVVSLRDIVIQTVNIELVNLILVAQVDCRIAHIKHACLLGIIKQVDDRLDKVDRAGNGILKVQDARAALSRGVQITVCIEGDHSSGFNDVLCEFCTLRLGERRIFGLQVLSKQKKRTARIRRCHGCSAVDFISVGSACNSRVDHAAGSADRRLELQRRRGAPAGEVAHKPCTRILYIHLFGRNEDGVVDIETVQNRQTCRLLNADRGYVVRIDQHADAAGLIVVKNHTDRALRRNVRVLFGECQIAADNKRNLAGNFIGNLFGRTGAAVYEFKRLICEGIKPAMLPVAAVIYISECFAVIDDRERRICKVLHGCNGDVALIGGRARNFGVIRILSQNITVACKVARIVRHGVFIARGDANDNACLIEFLIDVAEFFLEFQIINEAAGSADGHVDRINAKEEAVFQSCHVDAGVRAGSLIRKDLHEDQLGQRRRAHEFDCAVRIDCKTRDRAGDV